MTTLGPRDMSRKVRQHDEDLPSLCELVERVELKVDAGFERVDARFGDMHGQLGDVRGRLDSVDGRLDRLEDGQQQILDLLRNRRSGGAEQ